MLTSQKTAHQPFPMWEFPIKRPQAGPVLGNTTTGLMIWGEGNILKLSIGRADFWHLGEGAPWRDEQSYSNIRAALEARDETRLKEIFVPNEDIPQVCPVGRVELHINQEYKLHSAQLNIQKGSISVYIQHPDNASSFSIKITMDVKTGAVCFTNKRMFKVKVVPAWENEDCHKGFEKIQAPAPYIDANGFAQPLAHDPSCALAYYKDALYYFIYTDVYGTKGKASSPEKAYEHAYLEAKKLCTQGMRKIETRTKKYFKDFFDQVSDITIANEQLQTLHNYAQFKLACSSSEDPSSTPCSLQGPWYDDLRFPPWSGDYHFNINVQECYWPNLSNNRVEAFRPLFTMIKSWMPMLRENARKFVGIDDGIMMPHAVDTRGVAVWAGFWTGVMDHGSAMWVADLMWKYYDFGGNGGKEFLRDEAMPFMSGAFNVFYKMLDRADDGTLSLPIGISPEYRGAAMNAWGENASFQLAAAHRLAENLCNAAKELEIKEDPRWREMLSKLPKACVCTRDNGTKAIGLWKDTELEESHRHHSHMASIFPFDTIDWESPEWYDIVKQTYTHWMRQGTYFWTGWCLPWAAILHARVGNGDMAEHMLDTMLRAFTNEGYATLHDTCMSGISLFGMESIPTVEYPPRPEIMQLDATMAFMTAIHQMMIHERRGVHYLFAGIPADWHDTVFDKILTSGGVLVSAELTRIGCPNVTLKCGSRSTVFKLYNCWKQGFAWICDGVYNTVNESYYTKKIEPDQDNVFTLHLDAGQTVCLMPTEDSTPLLFDNSNDLDEDDDDF